MRVRCAVLAVGLLLVASSAAQALEGPSEGKPAKDLGPGAHMDFGGLIQYYLHSPADKKEIIYKAINVRLGADVGVSFDAETMRLAAGWQGGFVDMTTTNPARIGQGTGSASRCSPSPADLVGPVRAVRLPIRARTASATCPPAGRPTRASTATATRWCSPTPWATSWCTSCQAS